MKYRHLIICLLLLCFNKGRAQQSLDSLVYSVTRVANNSIKIDGKNKELLWQQASVISSFISPWSKTPPQKTSLQLLYDDNNLYFFFDVADTTLVCKAFFTDEMFVTKEDRVELFFSKTADLSSYIGFEIDPKGRILDYKAKHYKKFDYEWDADGIRVKARRKRGTYKVEGSISFDILKDYISNSNSIYWGAFRGDYSIVNSKLTANWICLRDPKTPKPDFHTPTAFSILRLSESKKLPEFH